MKVWIDRTILGILASAALFYSAGCSLESSVASLGGGVQSILGLPEVVNVCFSHPLGDSGTYYTRSTYVLKNGQWQKTDSDSSLSPPDDCIPSTDFFDNLVAEPNQSTGPYSTNEDSYPASSTQPAASGTVARAASAGSAVYPVEDPAYAKLLPFLAPLHSPTTPDCDPAASFYSVNHDQATVTRFVGCPPQPMQKIPVVSNPLQAVGTPDGRLVLVTSFDSAVNFIDTSTNQVTFTLPTPNLFPSGVAITADGSTAYVTNFDTGKPGVMVVDIASRAITGFITVPSLARSVFLTPDGTQAWVTSVGTSSIYVIDLLTKAVGWTINMTGSVQTGMAFNPTGSRAYVAVQPSSLVVLNASTMDAVATIAVPSPADVQVSPDGRVVIVTSYDVAGTLTAIDASTNKVISTIATGGPASGIVQLPIAP
jgi:DNA-binding beta-propeller fold protein YncE